MALDPREVQRQLMEKYNIHFDGPIDPTVSPRWPSSCHTIFQHIRQLGRTEYAEYRDSITADSLRFPWRGQVQRRAKRITEKAMLCIKGKKNESGWRLCLESEVMARFTVEIACRNCRGRLWRSEQEVIPNSQQIEDDINSLEARQSRRQPCACDTNGYNNDYHEQGISPLFDDRAEQGIVYAPELQAEMPQRENRPDRVYGLRVTRRLKRLLPKLLGRPIGEALKTTPFRAEGEPIVFPFLIIEAKSEKGADSLTDAEVQSAFAIRQLLLIQRELAQAADEDGGWDGGPLVWFLSYKGESWRVSAAYIDHQGTTAYYRVVRLWSGGIDSQESALQLLLIIDYIVDWARDIYREGIARSLQKLVVDDSKSLAHDTDIFSLADNVQNWTQIDDDTDEIEAIQTAEDPIRDLDSPKGVFRDARFIRTRFIGLIITEENLDEFLNSAPSNDAARKLAASLLASIEEACRVRRHVLDDLELVWTDTDRNVSDMTPPDTIFLVVITAVSYLTPDWEQTRELGYVAVAETLINDLCKIARVANSAARVFSRAPLVESMPSFNDLLNRSAWDNLCACASRLCIYTGCAPATASSSRSSFVWKMLPTETTQSFRKPRRDMALKAGPHCKARDFVYDLYSKHKIGRNEPTSCIFRLSSRLDEVAPPDQLLERQELLSDAMWPWANNVPRWRNQDVVLAVSEQRYKTATKAPLCIFVMNPRMLSDGIPSNQFFFSPPWHLRVKRYDRMAGWDKGWNLSDVETTDTADVVFKLEKLRHHLRTTKRLHRIDSYKSTRRDSKAFSCPMTLWDIITKGGIGSPASTTFEFNADRPFRRQEYQSSLKTTLLGLKKDGTPAPEPAYVIIDDDEPDLSQGDIDRIKQTPSPELGDREKIAVDDGEGNSTQSQMANSFGKLSTESQGQKRPLDSVEILNEAESSTHGSRRVRPRQGAEWRFSLDFFSDDEPEPPRVLADPPVIRIDSSPRPFL
ncbi:hypothetical protein FALBO_6141 [Fusarium albosuccineum]|uniref:DUF7924 domain-containing protein n=1 Tax=Fusarium albosuccineum TaxID=1237068 RepID=A0A8H4LFC9_9HYPO|nr:hypothetical protein FALBO_6141 [Fusarium albosuccineum]